MRLADLPLVVKLVQLESPLALPKVRRDLLGNKRGHLLAFLISFESVGN